MTGLGEVHEGIVGQCCLRPDQNKDADGGKRGFKEADGKLQSQRVML